MAIELLKPLQVHKAGAGYHSDGGGLFLFVRDPSSTWVLRYTSPGGKQRYMGLGRAERSTIAIAADGLTRVRKAARDARELLQRGVDPIDERQAIKSKAKAEASTRKSTTNAANTTLKRFARAYHERVVEPNRTTKHAAQWIASLENNVSEDIWNKPISKVAAPELLDLIAELQARIPETASRVRQRLEVIFDDAEFRGLRSGNPARAIRRKLREVRSRRRRGSFKALDYRKAPAFVKALRAQVGIAARALEFAALTASRTAEVIGAKWEEFDLAAGLWTIPGARMKGGEPHSVYLTPRATELVEVARALQQPFVFPSPALNGKPLSNMAMLTLLRRMDVNKETTVHGLCRATFSTFGNDLGIARPDVVEACLAHQEGDRVRRAYNRAQFAKERVALLTAWAEYLDGNASANNVVEFPQCKAA